MIAASVCHSSGWYYRISGQSYDAQRRCAYGSFTSGDVQQQWRTWGMIWQLSTPNNFVVYGQKHKVWVLVFLVRMRGTRWDQIWADLAKFSILQQNYNLYSIPFKWRCLVFSLTSSTFYDTSSTFYDVICLTERHDQFEHSNCSKETFLWKMYFHPCILKRGCALFSLWKSPHHGRHKTVENKNLMFGIIK